MLLGKPLGTADQDSLISVNLTLISVDLHVAAFLCHGQYHHRHCCYHHQLSAKATTTVVTTLPQSLLPRPLSQLLPLPMLLLLPHFVHCCLPPPYLLLSVAAIATAATTAPFSTSFYSLNNGLSNCHHPRPWYCRVQFLTMTHLCLCGCCGHCCCRMLP